MVKQVYLNLRKYYIFIFSNAVQYVKLTLLTVGKSFG